MNLGSTSRVASSTHKILKIAFNTLRNELIKIFRVFRVFEYALWQKAKTRKLRKLTEKFVNQKTTIANRYHSSKTTIKQLQW